MALLYKQTVLVCASMYIWYKF